MTSPAPALVIPKPTTPYEHAIVFLATGFGIGRMRGAPGTWGSALGVGIAWLVQRLDDKLIEWGVTLALILVGIPLCGEAARILGQKDPRRVVWDEIAAILVVFSIVPVTWLWGLVGFLLFRLFDIWKPWPMERLERLEGGLGIMIDDVAAAIMAGTLLAAMALPAWGRTP